MFLSHAPAIARHSGVQPTRLSALQAPGKKGGRKRAPPEFKDKILAVLEGAGHVESRSAKLCQEDFLALLAAFNAAGIHFA